MGRVGVAASSEFLDLDAGWPALHGALMDTGLDARVIVWDGGDLGGEHLDLVVVNYCWGYVTRRDAFLDWAARTAARSLLVNPLPALRWNSHKTYLADLATAGVPVVPTVFVPPGQTWVAPGNDYVLKPAVGSGGWWAARYARSAPDAAQRHLSMLHAAGQTVLVQPYQHRVDTEGETAMVFFGHRFSHAVHKAALLDPDAGVTDRLWEREVITPTTPSNAHLEVAQAAMAAVAERFGNISYARVDVIDTDDGTPAVLEVELVEPSLFLNECDGSAARFAEVLVERRMSAHADASRG